MGLLVSCTADQPTQTNATREAVTLTRQNARDAAGMQDAVLRRLAFVSGKDADHDRS
jgi:hypothetical protein